MALVTPAEPVALADLGRVHFAGIGGAGMSGIARIMLARGVIVSGSDQVDSPALRDLAARGARVSVGHHAANLGDADSLVVSSAIRPDNPELTAATERGLRVVHRAAALAALMAGRRVITVTGTHGKTTTTSMLTTIFRETGADPAYAIGGVLAATGSNADDGTGQDFIAEADESDGSFLMFAPDAAVVTNIDADHLDNYGTVEAYRASFRNFLARIVPGGLLVCCADDPGTRDLAEHARRQGLRVVTYGAAPDADYRLSGVRASGMETAFLITGTHGSSGIKNGLEIRLSVPGAHNALNAAAAFAVAAELGVLPEAAAMALAAYTGAGRRLEPKGEAAGVRVLDTYAHHPAELAADLRAARGIAGAGRVIAVFQPHLFSRTRIFAAEFGAALALADEAVVLDVYAAREDPEPGVTGQLIADSAQAAAQAEAAADATGGPGRPARVHYVPGLADAPKAVAAIAAPGDLVLTMGAGDVTKLGPLILDELSAAS